MTVRVSIHVYPDTMLRVAGTVIPGEFGEGDWIDIGDGPTGATVFCASPELADQVAARFTELGERMRARRAVEPGAAA
jgi:hypothetical protein